MANPTGTGNPFSIVFSGREPEITKLSNAVALLREMLDKEPNPKQQELWARALRNFGEAQLAEAFNWVSLTSKGWPTLGDITECIFDAEFAADLRWLLRNLARHGVEWKERPAVYGDRWRKPGAHMDDWQPGKLLEEAQCSPPISDRLETALRTISAGNTHDGLHILSRHPAIKSNTLAGDEAAKVKFQIERDFKAAWLMARRRELGGSL